MAHVERRQQLSSVIFLLFAELVGGADWSNCGAGADVVMHFPDPHGKGFPTKFSLNEWGGDSTDSIGGRLDLNGYVRLYLALDFYNRRLNKQSYVSSVLNTVLKISQKNHDLVHLVLYDHRHFNFFPCP